MATRASPESQASQARRLYTEELVKGLASLVQAGLDSARDLLDKPAEHLVAQRRRDLMQGLMTGAQTWHRGIVGGLRQVLLGPDGSGRPSDVAPLAPPPGTAPNAMTLVSDDTIELEIVTSRLALAIMDKASWEFSDLRSRMAHLAGRAELEPQDMLRAHVLARIAFEAWRGAGLGLEGWRELQPVLHAEFAALVTEAYHETNRPRSTFGPSFAVPAPTQQRHWAGRPARARRPLAAATTARALAVRRRPRPTPWAWAPTLASRRPLRTPPAAAWAAAPTAAVPAWARRRG
jgi:Protein of unknown function (DUF1631)